MENPLPASHFQNDEVERRIFSKLIIRLFPLLMLALFMAYMDRANLAVIKTPLSHDLSLTASGYGLAAGIFYLGYLLFEVPSNIALYKFGARLWIARILVSWGVVTFVFVFVAEHRVLIGLRFLLGAAEAGLFPGVILYLTYWFPSRLFAKAYSTFELAIPIALTVTTLITSTILSLDGLLGLSGWRWVFVMQGAATIALGVVVLRYLPDGPKDALWLTQDERHYILAHTHVANDTQMHEQGALFRLMKRPVIWIHAGLYFTLNISFWTITYWMPTLIQERLKVSPIQAGYLSSIPWACLFFVMYGVGVSSTKTGDRRWHIVGCLTLACIGLLTSAFSTEPITVMVGLCAAASGCQAVMPIFWSHTSTVLKGAMAATGIAIVNSIGNVSGFVGPYIQGLLFDITGKSTTGLVVMSGFFVISAIWTLLLMPERIAPRNLAPRGIESDA